MKADIDVYNELKEIRLLLEKQKTMANRALLIAGGAMGLSVLTLGFLITYILR